MKRKVLCLILALMTVLALLPTTLISAAMAAVWASSASAPENTEDAPIEVLDASGGHVGYYATLGEADAVLEDGFVLRLLRDVTLTETFVFGAARPKFVERHYSTYEKTSNDVTTTHSGGQAAHYCEPCDYPPIAFTVDGNGHKIVYTAKSFASVSYALSFRRDSEADAVTVQNLTIVSNSGCLGIDLRLIRSVSCRDKSQRQQNAQ